MPIYRVTPNFYAVDIEAIASGFILKVFCGYYVLSNSPNWKNFNMISTFGVIFGQNLCICHPTVPIYAVLPKCYAFDVEDITLGFNLGVFFFVTLCYLMTKTRRILT